MDILVLDDGLKGNFNQAYGIASAFPGARIETIKVSLKGPSYALPGRKGKYPVSAKLLALLCTFRMRRTASAFLKKTLPEARSVSGKKFNLVISAGSVLAPVNLVLARETRAKSVCVMVPALLDLGLFDFLIIPYHDYIKLPGKRIRKNLIVTLGAPNRITEAFLKKEKERLKNTINFHEGRKTVGVIIGGDDQNYHVSTKFVNALISALSILENRYSFIFTTSRRTPEKSIISLQERLLKNPMDVIYSEFPGYSAESQYPGILSLCDYILVTEDSINMISEAASTCVPVIILGVERKNPSRKLVFDLCLEKLTEKGYAEYLPGNELYRLKEKLERNEGVSFRKLNEAEECALKISKSLR